MSIQQRSVFLALASAALLATTSPASGAQGRDWEFVELPHAGAPNGDDMLPALDGVHIDPRARRDEAPDSLGELLTPRALESAILGRMDLRSGDASVEVLDGRLLVRGNREFRDSVRASTQALARELDGLNAKLRVRLIGPSESPDEPGFVIDEAREIRTGERASFGERQVAMFLTDFDVEVAMAEAVADPVVTPTWLGETVHLWTSTRTRAEGDREIVVQGLLDIAVLTGTQRFDTDIYEFGALEVPIVDSVQVLFSGVVDTNRPLRVKLSGLPAGLGSRTLEITREATGFEDPARRIVDFSGGLWRTMHVGGHTLHDGREWQLATAPTPGSALQLFSAVFGGSGAGARPVFSESIAVLPADDRDVMSEFPAFAAELDAAGVPRMLLVRRGELRAEVPVLAETLARVAVTHETVATTDYDPQIANEASIPDPISQRITSGFVCEGALRGDSFRGLATEVRVNGDATTSGDSGDLGRIVLPRTGRVSAPVRVRPQAPVTPFEGVSISWSPAVPDALEPGNDR